MTDPGLRFWLHHVEASGGLWERAGDSVLVVLPPQLSRRYRLAEELVVTDDPDVARFDGSTFLGTGHPVLAEAAESVLEQGDAGLVRLTAPPGPPPSREVLQGHVREQVPVSHGRIDAVGPPRHVIHWVLRVGAMVSYAVSTDDHFSERNERWVHVASRRELPKAVVARLAHAAPFPGEAAAPGDPVPAGDLARALAEADRLIAAEALRRQTELARELGAAHDAEQARAITYYSDVIAGIERRLDAAPPERRALLEARLANTREEQIRRLAEIAKKYQAHHEIRPFRLHAVGVPALRLPVDVRRGERRYPMELDWLRPAGAFAQPRCPACDSAAPLVAGKSGLGCLMCLTPKTPIPAPTPAAPVPAARPKPAADAAPAPIPVQPKPAPAKAAATKPPTSRGQPHLASVAAKKADNLTTAVWDAVVNRRTRRLQNMLAPDSPASALHAVYGAAGVGHAIGLPGSEEPVAVTAGSTQVADGWGTTTGMVRTTRNEYPYVLRWRAEHQILTVAEVLPFPLYPDGRFHAYYWWFGDQNPHRRIPRPAADRLDEVALLLLRDGGPWHGLAVAARALAAWGRLREQHDRLIDTHSAAVLAAAVHRLVAHRAGDKGLFQDAADAYRAEPAAVRRADTQLRKLLTLGPERNW